MNVVKFVFELVIEFALTSFFVIDWVLRTVHDFREWCVTT